MSQPWTDANDQAMKIAASEGLSVSRLAVHLKRTEGAVKRISLREPQRLPAPPTMVKLTAMHDG